MTHKQALHEFCELLRQSIREVNQIKQREPKGTLRNLGKGKFSICLETDRQTEDIRSCRAKNAHLSLKDFTNYITTEFETNLTGADTLIS